MTRTRYAFLSSISFLLLGGVVAWQSMRPIRAGDPGAIVDSQHIWYVVGLWSVLFGLASGLIFIALARNGLLRLVSFVCGLIVALGLVGLWVANAPWPGDEVYMRIATKGPALFWWLLSHRWHVYDMVLCWLLPQTVALWITVAFCHWLRGKMAPPQLTPRTGGS